MNIIVQKSIVVKAPTNKEIEKWLVSHDYEEITLTTWKDPELDGIIYFDKKDKTQKRIEDTIIDLANLFNEDTATIYEWILKG